jgi:general secretion pathway protein D
MAQKEGNELIAIGKIEAGLSKLEEASRLEPGLASYRSNYLRAKETAIIRYLQHGDRLVANGKFKDAEKTYQTILHFEPENDDRALTAIQNLSTQTRHTQWYQEAELAFQKKNTELALHNLHSILLRHLNMHKHSLYKAKLKM